MPAFITYPGFRRQGAIGRAFADVMDILPTVLSATDIRSSGNLSGRQVAKVRGRSMMPYLLARSDVVHHDDEPISFELHGQRAVRKGPWKLLYLGKPLGKSRWALYNVVTDPGEHTDLSDAEPDRRKALMAAWAAFAREARIAPLS